MKLVDNWKDAWKWLSVQFTALIVAWSLTPVDMQTALLAITGWPAERVTAALGLLALIGRIVSQGEKKSE